MLAVLKMMLAVQMAEDIHIKKEAAFSDSLLFYLQNYVSVIDVGRHAPGGRCCGFHD